MNRHFTKENMQMNNKKRFTSLLIKELQIQTIKRCNYMLTKMAKLKKMTIQSVGKAMEKSELSFIAGEAVKSYDDFGKQLHSFLQSKTNLPCDSEILLFGIYPRKMRTYVHTKVCTQMFIVLFITASN